MTKNFYLLLLLLTIWSCDEIPTKISDPNFDEDRVVLIEEFSGGNCNPCADAALILKDLQAKHGNNLVVVTAHTFLGGPYEQVFGATYNFGTQNGQDLIEELGLPLGPPSAVINRKLYEGATTLQLGRDTWSATIDDEREIKPKANVKLNIEYNSGERMLNVEATIIPFEDISENTRLTLLITENHLIDKQSTPNGVVDDWEHNHILRDYISGLNGISLGDELTTGNPIIKEFSYKIPPEDGWWVAENLEVVAYISEITSNSKEVLQAASAHVVE